LEEKDMSTSIVTDTVQANPCVPPPSNGKDVKAASDAADVTASQETEETGEAGETEETTKRTPKKIYVVAGSIYEFANAREAEKFLNTDNRAPRDYTVIKGNAVEQKKKVSLR
jgi:hypothetical protein